MKRWILIGVGVLVLAGLYFLGLRGRRGGGVAVEVEEVTHRDLVSIVSATGKIEPKRSVDIGAEVVGTITRLAVDEGDSVQTGQFLMQIDPTQFRATLSRSEAALKAARANLELAEANFRQAEMTLKRKQELFERRLIPEEELEAAQTDWEVKQAQLRRAREEVAEAEAAVASARHDVERVTITSPMNGVVTRLNVEEGEVVVVGTINTPGSILMTVADLSLIEAQVEVDETDIVNVQVGQEAKVAVDAFPDTTFRGVVTEVGKSPITSTRDPNRQVTNFLVKISLSETDPLMRPGLSCTADVTTATRDQVPSVPIQSLVLREPEDEENPETDSSPEEREEVEGVFVVKNGKAGFRPVRTGIASQRHYEVLEGLQDGEQVVSGPYKVLRELKDAQAVKIQEKKKG